MRSFAFACRFMPFVTDGKSREDPFGRRRTHPHRLDHIRFLAKREHEHRRMISRLWESLARRSIRNA